jgi:hypothetical protein
LNAWSDSVSDSDSEDDDDWSEYDIYNLVSGYSDESDDDEESSNYDTIDGYLPGRNKGYTLENQDQDQRIIIWFTMPLP